MDAYRSIAFNDTDDLKGIMKEKGMQMQVQGPETNPGDPDDEMYLRQAEHLMKRGVYHPAIIYLHKSLTMNPDSKVKQACRVAVTSSTDSKFNSTLLLLVQLMPG